MTTELTKQEFAKQLQAIQKVVEAVQNAIGHRDLTAAQFRLFCLIARCDLEGNPAVSNQLAKDSGMTAAGVSRALKSFSHVGRLGRQGYDLVEYRENPDDRRYKILSLTRHGLKVAEQIGAANYEINQA